MEYKKYPNIVFEMSDYSVRTSTEADTYYMDHIELQESYYG